MLPPAPNSTWTPSASLVAVTSTFEKSCVGMGGRQGEGGANNGEAQRGDAHVISSLSSGRERAR